MESGLPLAPTADVSNRTSVELKLKERPVRRVNEKFDI